MALGTYTPADTSIPMDYSGGQSWDPNGGGMIEAAPASGSTIAMTSNPPASSAVTASPAASRFSLFGSFMVGSLSIPYLAAGLAVLGLAMAMGKRGGR